MEENPGTISASINMRPPPLTMADIELLNKNALEQATAIEQTQVRAEAFLKGLNINVRQNLAEAQVPYRTFASSIARSIKSGVRREMIHMEPYEFNKFTGHLLDQIHKLALIGTDCAFGRFRLREFRSLTLTEKLEHYKVTLNRVFSESLSHEWFIDLIKRIDEAIKAQIDIFGDYRYLSRHLVEIYMIAFANKRAPTRFAELIKEKVENPGEIILTVNSGWTDFIFSVKRLDMEVSVKMDTYATSLISKFLFFCDEPGLKWTSANEIKTFIQYADDLAKMDERYSGGWNVTRIKARTGLAILTFIDSQWIKCPLNYDTDQFIFTGVHQHPLTLEKYDEFLREFGKWATGDGFNALNELLRQNVVVSGQSNFTIRSLVESKEENIKNTEMAKSLVLKKVKYKKKLQDSDIEILNKFKDELIKTVRQNRLYQIHDKQPNLFEKLDRVYVNAYNRVQKKYDIRQNQKRRHKSDKFMPLLSCGTNVTFSTRKDRFVKIVDLDTTTTIQTGLTSYVAAKVGTLRLGTFKHPDTNEVFHLDLPGVYYLEEEGLLQEIVLSPNLLIKYGFLQTIGVHGDDTRTYCVGLPGTNIYFNTLERDRLTYVNFSQIYTGNLIESPMRESPDSLALWKNLASRPPNSQIND